MAVLCSICSNVRLQKISEEGIAYECPKCKTVYLDDNHEIMKHEDELGSAHDEESATLELAGLSAGGPGLLSAAADLIGDPSLDEQYEQEHNKDKIKIPKYMKDGPVTTVEEYHEEVI